MALNDVWTKGLKTFQDDLTCPICLGVFVDPYRLPCNHYFCHGCIDQVHAQNKGVPNVRVYVASTSS